MTKIAAIQMCSSHIVEDNLQKAAHLLQQAASQGAELVVLPEMFAIIGQTPLDKVNSKEEFNNEKIQTFLADQAKLYNIWIVSGTIPLACKNKNKIKAASLVYNNHGKMIARYDKMHLFDVTLSDTERYSESDTTEAGNEIVVVDTPIGKLGLSVCYDIRFPVLYTQLANLGAEIITIPSAFTMKTGEAHWELLARSRAVENFCYVIGACQGGVHSGGRKTHGHSLIVDPWGNVIKKAPKSGEAIIYADINLQNLHKIRESIPTKKHQKIKLDLSSLT